MCKKFYFFAFFLTLIVACNSNRKDERFNQLLGKWRLVEASRNGKITESLQNAFYEFRAEGTMTTNITGVEESSPFELKKKVLTQQVSPPVVYQINQMDEKTLILTTIIQNFEFKLSLNR